jgi:cytochrome P450
MFHLCCTGDHHKRQRKIVTPVFSVAQLRQLTPLIYHIAEKVDFLLG